MQGHGQAGQAGQAGRASGGGVGRPADGLRATALMLKRRATVMGDIDAANARVDQHVADRKGVTAGGALFPAHRHAHTQPSSHPELRLLGAGSLACAREVERPGLTSSGW